VVGLKGFSEHLPDKGTYTLLIFIPSERLIKVGSLGICRFRRGYYAYTGSALGKGALSLAGRISRHLKKEKRKRWHIDFLLADEDVKVVSVLIFPTEERMECEVNRYFKSELNGEVVVPNFGSSDCRSGCGSHLLYLGNDKKIINEIVDSFKKKMDEVIILQL